MINIIENWINKRKPFIVLYILLIMSGGLMNISAVMHNGGRMPVWSDTDYSTDTHFTFQDTSSIKKFLLTDWIYIRIGYTSIGDLFILAGGFMLILFMLGNFILFVNKIIKKVRGVIFEENKKGL
jgi:hypothetical protein